MISALQACAASPVFGLCQLIWCLASCGSGGTVGSWFLWSLDSIAAYGDTRIVAVEWARSPGRRPALAQGCGSGLCFVCVLIPRIGSGSGTQLSGRS